MNCDACGFDMGNSLGDSGRCMGCGVPLGPSSDEPKPGPGFSVNEFDKSHIVTEADRERYPDLEGVDVIREKQIRWGRGIGAETYGYYVREAEEVVDLPVWRDDEPDECPECNGTRAVHEYGFDGCVAHYDRLRCVLCDHEFYENFEC